MNATDNIEIKKINLWEATEEFITSEYDSWPRYIVFLSDSEDKCFNCCKICNKQKKLCKKLTACGITVLYNPKKPEYTGLYDDNSYPEINTIYIRLTKNKYYSDMCYPQKKAELEREILFLLTGLLGGRKITCHSQVSNNKSSLLNIEMKSQIADESVTLKQNISKNNNLQRDEVYENTGAVILIESQDQDYKIGWKLMLQKLLEVFEIIEKTSIASFDYFLQNSDLYTFAFKRYLLKLNNYVYRIEEDRVIEKSIQARTILYSYGLSLALDTKSTCSKIHEYIIEFYNLNELKDYFDIKKLEDKYAKDREIDIFANLRREYELNNIIMKKYWPDWGGDEKPIYREVINYSKKINIYNELKKWINEGGNLNEACHWFKSKMDVDVWLFNILHIDLN